MSKKSVQRKKIWRRDGKRCWLCGLHVEWKDTSRDHVMPKSFGGAGSMANLRISHQACNNRRGNSVNEVFVEVAGLIALRWNVRSL